jgi:spore coat polysaccharide biosynthesis protein SpsF
MRCGCESGAAGEGYCVRKSQEIEMKRRLVAAIACRNQGSRLYGKPLQNLDVADSIRIIDNVIACLETLQCIDEIVLGISEGVENEVFKEVATSKGLRYVVGDQIDVLSRLVACGRLAGATDIFRVTSESPFLYFEEVETLWNQHQEQSVDATFMDDVIDGCGFEIIRLEALERSHSNGDRRHRSELCTLYIREHPEDFAIVKAVPPPALVRKDLRLTVDNPEDLAVCRIVYGVFKAAAPRIPVTDIVAFLDANPGLIEWIAPYTEVGYATMYR